MNKLTKMLLLAMITVIAAGLLYGCGKRPETIESEFTELISSEEKVTPESMDEAADYMTKYLHKLDEDKASIMLISYEAYATKYINTDADQNQVQTLLPFYSEKLGKIDGDKLKKDKTALEYFEKLTDGYVGVHVAEGKIVLRPDYDSLEKEFGRDVKDAVQELYELKAVINDRPATENATLQISYDELLSRAFSVEELIREHSGEKLIEQDVKWMYNSYLNIIFMGTTNSPAFDYQTGVFSQEARDAYESFAKEHPDTQLAWAIGEYFKYVEQIGYTINYKDSDMSKAFFDNCSRIVSETEKRVYQ